MSASSGKERDEWLQCITESIREHPFHDIVAAKKAALLRKTQATPRTPRTPRPPTLNGSGMKHHTPAA